MTWLIISPLTRWQSSHRTQSVSQRHEKRPNSSIILTGCLYYGIKRFKL